MTETEFALVRFKGDTAKAAAPYRGVHPMSSEEVAESVFWSCRGCQKECVSRFL